jgi:hypothetical protein
LLIIKRGENPPLFLFKRDSVTRFSTSGFFHQSTPPRAHMLKPFRIWLRIRRNNRHYSSFSGVNDTAETDFGDFRSDYLGEYEAICETVLAC